MSRAFDAGMGRDAEADREPEIEKLHAKIDLYEGLAERLGFRLAPGGVHLSKTMMFADLTAVFDSFPNGERVLSTLTLRLRSGNGS